MTLSLAWPKYCPVMDSLPLSLPHQPQGLTDDKLDADIDGEEDGAEEVVEGVEMAGGGRRGLEEGEVMEGGVKYKLEYVTMFISEEDICIFVDCCSDQVGVGVRERGRGKVSHC